MQNVISKTYVRVKLRSKTGTIEFKDLLIEGKKANQEVMELALYQVEEVETLVQKVVIGEPPALSLVKGGKSD